MAVGEDQVSLTIRDHKFTPAEIRVPRDTRITISVSNEDATPEEVESHDLRFEKVIPGNSKGTVRFGPVDEGRYTFFGHLKWSWAIALGYAAGIGMHLLVNARHFTGTP